MEDIKDIIRELKGIFVALSRQVKSEYQTTLMHLDALSKRIDALEKIVDK